MSITAQVTADHLSRERTQVLPRRLRAVPSEPPYDDATTAPATHRTPGNALLPIAAPTPLPIPLPALALLGDRTTIAPDERTARPTPCGGSRVDAELNALFGSRRTPRSELPDPRDRAAAAVRILLEVLAGDRPARQVAAWVSPLILERLENHRITPAHRRARTCYLRSLRISEPSDAVAEVTAVIAHDASDAARRRAVAMRLEGRDGRWTVTALTVG
jgi:hypothetical protein